MQVDKASMGRTLRKRKEKVAKHLKRGANEKETDNFLKRVLRISLEKPFEEAYFTHRLWMFFRETKETEEDIRRMFHYARDKMKNMITLKKRSDPGKFAIPCLVKPSKESFTFVDCSQRNSGGMVRDLEVQIGNALVPLDFHVLDIKLNWNSSLLLGRAFLSTGRSSMQHANQPVVLRSLLSCTFWVSPLSGAQLCGSIFGREDDQAGTGTPHRASPGNMSGSKGEEALAEYKRALEVMSAKKAAPKKTAPVRTTMRSSSPRATSVSLLLLWLLLLKRSLGLRDLPRGFLLRRRTIQPQFWPISTLWCSL
ncbi:hypothetical protein F2Q68_00040134 [Brassica cretica]|uniref:Uncharacterized protein n=1 Tax=Brassica cretica TaxID=69181 RepID=A0A8S9MHC9_BRACR|nr:hypothetical protein F2Q68_00040134 [Brassica cretica]